ncbi:MAG TPA: hypothetical protein VJL29_16405 [Thermoguttaceae bacterium]|nr:hypothetical protein [Thermoguttaceae bacterium]
MARRIILFVIFASALSAAARSDWAQAAERLDVATIKMALNVTDLEDNGFIERVVRLMNEGRISRTYVTGAFAKARSRPKNQFQYFKQAMINLALRDGVDLTKPDPPASSPSTNQSLWQRLLARLRELAPG